MIPTLQVTGINNFNEILEHQRQEFTHNGLGLLMILVITNDNRDLGLLWYWDDVEGWNYWEKRIIWIELPFFTTIYHLFPLG